jgi:hypothetical protein
MNRTGKAGCCQKEPGFAIAADLLETSQQAKLCAAASKDGAYRRQ